MREQGIARTDLPHGCGKPDVGSAAYSWRVEDARLRHLRANSLEIDAKGSEEPRTGETVESLPEQSPRSHRRNGLLHCPHAHLWCAIWLLCRILHFNVTRHLTSEWTAAVLPAKSTSNRSWKKLNVYSEFIFVLNYGNSITG